MNINVVHYQQIIDLQYHRDEHENIVDIVYTKPIVRQMNLFMVVYKYV